MLKEIRDFYELLKVKGVEWNISDEEMPIAFIKIFKKSYPRLKQAELPEPQSQNLEKLLEKRESYRDFSDKPLNLNQVSQLFNSCKILDSDKDPERRTYPSGGARFPVELYLINYNIENLNKGAYHFNINNFCLETLWEKNLDDKVSEIGGTNIINPAATIVFTSVIARSEVKYWYKALPFSYLEAGHIGQNILLAAAENDIGACPVSGFVDDTLIGILDLTENEIPVYTIHIGNKKI